MRVSKVTSLDLVRRSFRRDRPNELWMTDITEHPTREGKVYCAVVLDAFSRRVVGWSIDSTQTTTLVLNALGMATQRRQDRDGLIIHSDRGVQLRLNRSSQHGWCSVVQAIVYQCQCEGPVPSVGDDPEGVVPLRDRSG